MAKIVVEKELCKGCELCLSVCPQKLLRLSSESNSKGYHYTEQINEEKCTGCRLCGIMCPDLAISVYK